MLTMYNIDDEGWDILVPYYQLFLGSEIKSKVQAKKRKTNNFNLKSVITASKILIFR